MAFVQADIDALDAAIKSLASGAKRVRYGEREVEFHDLADLMTLRQQMRAEVSGTAGPIYAGRL